MPNIVEILSPERFGTYRGWSSGDEALAIRLYTYNVLLSTALYGPLHMLEVALRNVVDSRLEGAFGADWFDHPGVLKTTYQTVCVRKARETLAREGKAGDHSQLIAELNLGFWSSLFSREVHRLWGTLRPAFQAKGTQRHQIAGQLRDLRILRNRIAHYEPILALPLGQRYASITTLTGWLSPSAAAWIAETSTWPGLYPGVPVLVPDAEGELRVAPAVLPYLPGVIGKT